MKALEGLALKGKFTANLIGICRVSEVGPRLIPVVESYAKQEGIKIRGDEQVAIFHVLDTWSFHVIFLKPKMTLAEIERRVHKYLSAELTAPSKEFLEKIAQKRLCDE